MIKESFKTISITSLCLKDKDLSNLSLEEIVSIYISIHAPTRGATAFFSLFLLLKDTANHFLKSFVSFSSFYYELVARFLCPALNLISL